MAFTYRTIRDTATGDFRDRGSKFFSFAYPITQREEVKGLVGHLKKEHPKAVHYCFAYRTGTEGTDFRVNDDGEPGGSAGRPILGQIDSMGLTNVLLVVVRYFGGILLGVPGLIHAYKTAAQCCLDAADIIERNIERSLHLEFSYDKLGEVMQVMKQGEVSVLKQDMALYCTLDISIAVSVYDNILKRFREIYGVEIREQVS